VRRKISLLGATGSVGISTLDVIERQAKQGVDYSAPAMTMEFHDIFAGGARRSVEPED
jgi:1-deoxy-D-xylulose 5-phosphate reductoisomerase